MTDQRRHPGSDIAIHAGAEHWIAGLVTRIKAVNPRVLLRDWLCKPAAAEKARMDLTLKLDEDCHLVGLQHPSVPR